MRYISLSSHPNKPCGILKFKGIRIMLNASLDMTPLLSFLPLPLVPSGHFSNLTGWNPKGSTSSTLTDNLIENELKECSGRVFIDSTPEFSAPDLNTFDLKHVDVILITSYQTMMALPYLTEMTQFSGHIYATEPTLAIGKMFMLELIEYLERTPKVRKASAWKSLEDNFIKSIPFPSSLENYHVKDWRQIYTRANVSECLAKVKIVSFNQKIDIFGALEATPLSSGHLIGSCNWIISSDHEKICYLSSSSTLTTHPRPIEMKPMTNSDLMIVTNLTQAPTANPDNSLGELCVSVASTVRNGANVLIPSFTSGIIYDLIECLISHLSNAGLGGVPVYFISPVADQSLAYANILSEWLTSSKQARVFGVAGAPEEPFVHSNFVKDGRLKHYPSVSCEAFSNDFRTPCVVFTGHPSLRVGDVVHFIELWSSSVQNLLVITEPEFAYLEALSPYQPISMKVIYSPIDTSLSFAQANKLLSDLAPKNLLLPYSYTVPPNNLRHRNDLIIDGANLTLNSNSTSGTILAPNPTSVKTLTIPPGTMRESIKIPIKRSFTKVYLDSEITAKLVPHQIKPGLSLATLTGSLEAKDNKFQLKALSSGQVKRLANWSPGRRSLPPPKQPFGPLDIQAFMACLIKAGILDAQLDQTPNGTFIRLGKEEAFITLDDATTHIVCDIGSPYRLLLRDLVFKCLKSF